MEEKSAANKPGLTLRHDINVDITSIHSRDFLLSLVFGTSSTSADDPPYWTASGFFISSGPCVAAMETTILHLMCGGSSFRIGAVRGVAVHPDWRGHGLFRDLMRQALDEMNEAGVPLVMLYTETPDLYRRFGFQPVPQQAFVGTAPCPSGTATCRPIGPMKIDWPAMAHLHASREPLSERGALMGAPALFYERLKMDTDIKLAMIGEDEALVAYEIDGDMLTLVDVVAPAIPSLATIVGAMDRPFETVKTLFPPDKLGWTGIGVDDDTGLMIRGTIPPAITPLPRFPPTTEF